MNSNIVPLPARSRPQELRRETRITTNGRAVLQVVQSDDPQMLGITFHADVIEASPGGMRLTCDRLIENCAVEAWININGYRDKLFLAGQVRWSSWEAGGDCQLGLELTPHSLTDDERWGEICHLL